MDKPKQGKEFDIETGLISALASWAGNNFSSPAIAQLFLEGDRIIATDTRRMVIHPFQSGVPALAIPAALIRASVAAQDVLNRTGLIPRIEHDLYALDDGDNGLTDGPHGDRTLRIVVDAKRIHVRISDDVSLSSPHGTLERLADIIQLEKSVAEQTECDQAEGWILNPEYLACIGAVLRVSGVGESGVKIKRWLPGKISPVELTSKAGTRFIIMPMKIQSHD